MRVAPLLALLPFFPLRLALADAPAVRARAESGGFILTLLSDPTPLRAGRSRWSVLVQSAPGGSTILDVAVHLRLARVDAKGAVIEVPATTSDSPNKLLHAAWVDLPEPGAWHVTATAQRGDGRGEVQVEVQVEEALSAATRMWPYLVAPFAILAFLGLREYLVRRRGPAP